MPINTEFFKFCAHLLKKQKFTINSQYEYFSVKNGCYDIVTIKKGGEKIEKHEVGSSCLRHKSIQL